MEKIREFINKIDNLSIRERGIILFAILFVLYSAWDGFFMGPLSITEKKITSELKQKQAEQLVLNTRLQQLVAQSKIDPDSENRKKLNELKVQLDQIESEVKSSTQYLISQKAMARVLETVLLKTKGLELIEIKGLGAQPLLAESAEKQQEGVTEKKSAALEKPPGGGIENAYKHGLKISFEGDYLTTLDFIRELESLEWGFFWDQFEFEVKKYPEARASITVYTLSLDKDWIGV